MQPTSSKCYVIGCVIRKQVRVRAAGNDSNKCTAVTTKLEQTTSRLNATIRIRFADSFEKESRGIKVLNNFLTLPVVYS
jgi:hypothetical protein